MNRETELCEGCARTLTEIGNWFNLSDDEKREIIADLPNRDPKPKSSGTPASKA